uniref:DUF5610 domain-containing protein n=1 Tax=Geobacter metallireducens TaxID=28232 RepID=A0A831XD77_GEOME
MVHGIGPAQTNGVKPAEREGDTRGLHRGAAKGTEKDFRKDNDGKDTVSLGTEEESREVSYARQLEEARRSGAKFLMLRELVAKMFTQQGLATAIETGGGETVEIEDLTPEQARALVADDGYWGVEQTSDRIFRFATSLANGDTALLDKIKEGVLQGFEQAKEDFGGSLPEISQKTVDAVMKKLDDWAREAREAAEGGEEAGTAA